MTDRSPPDPPSAQLAPVSAPSDVARAERELDELDDDELMGLLETHDKLWRNYYLFGFLVLVGAGVASWLFELGSGWTSVFTYSYFVCAGFAALGTRYYLRGEAKRIGLSRRGLKDFFRGLRKLSYGSSFADSRRRGKEIRAAKSNEERLRLRVRHLREG